MKAVIVFLLIIGATLSAQTSKVVRKINLDAKGLTLMRIENGSGELDIIGRKDINQIEAELVFELPERMSEKEADEYIDDHVRIESGTRGGRGLLVTENRGRWNWNWNEGLRMRVTVYMPGGIDLDVHDNSGSMSIRDIDGNLDVEDGSGSLSISDISGNVRVEDGSGSLDIFRIGGNLKVDDGSGSLTIEDVRESVTVDDGSGSVRIRNVGGDVVILNEGSGSLSIHDVKGRVENHDD
ncbi:MAG TPA: DUF4097 family beta strand repeat-containing protein [Calditrichia bacterium]|nr:DUF4097 family beta strand repeat-containing protein [Calditrichia bacterium]